MSNHQRIKIFSCIIIQIEIEIEIHAIAEFIHPNFVISKKTNAMKIKYTRLKEFSVQI